jgi:hypothetical protein
MVESFAVFRLDLPKLENAKLVDGHVTDLTAPATQESFLSLVAWEPPAFT